MTTRPTMTCGRFSNQKEGKLIGCWGALFGSGPLWDGEVPGRRASGVGFDVRGRVLNTLRCCVLSEGGPLSSRVFRWRLVKKDGDSSMAIALAQTRRERLEKGRRMAGVGRWRKELGIVGAPRRRIRD